MAGNISLPPVSKFFVPLPEAKLKERPKHVLRSKRCYFPKTNEKGIELFMDAVTHGVPGLWITSTPPEILRKRWKLFATPILWITQRKSQEEVTAKPSEPERIIKIVKNYFLSGIPKAVVLMDCLQDLVLVNGYQKSIKMLNGLLKVCSGNNAVLIVSPNELSSKDVEKLKKEVRGRVSRL